MNEIKLLRVATISFLVYTIIAVSVMYRHYLVFGSTYEMTSIENDWKWNNFHILLLIAVFPLILFSGYIVLYVLYKIWQEKTLKLIPRILVAILFIIYLLGFTEFDLISIKDFPVGIYLALLYQVGMGLVLKYRGVSFYETVVFCLAQFSFAMLGHFSVESWILG